MLLLATTNCAVLFPPVPRRGPAHPTSTGGIIFFPNSSMFQINTTAPIAYDSTITYRAVLATFYSKILPCSFVFLKMWRPPLPPLERHMRYMGSGSNSSSLGPFNGTRISCYKLSIVSQRLSRVFITFCFENPLSHSTELTGKTILIAISLVILGNLFRRKHLFC